MEKMNPKIAIVVHGRFHAFNLAAALLRKGADVRLFTNYPRWAVRRFGFPAERTESFWLHAIIWRLLLLVFRDSLPEALDKWVHGCFGRWASRRLLRKDWDVVYAFSGIAEESFLSLKDKDTLKLLLRSNAHIRTQKRLLEEESQRTSARVELPSAWMLGREEREYRLCDYIVVTSAFAKKTFLEQGFGEEKLFLLSLGTDVAAFSAKDEIIQARRKRILANEKLRLLYVGTLSYRKGFFDLLALAESLPEGRFSLRTVGPQSAEVRPQLKRLAKRAEIIPKQPQQDLPNWYAWADIFIFPTTQEGFGVVLTQAYAAGLAIISTDRCAAPDFIENGRNGWIVPAGSSGAFLKQLEHCDSHRSELAEVIARVHQQVYKRDWLDVAGNLLAFYSAVTGTKKRSS